MKENIKTKKKTNLKSRNVLLVLGIIYTLITILAIITYVSKMNNISTTPVTFGSVLGSAWWQLLMIVLFILTYVLYSKKPLLGTLLEVVMGMAMLVYIIISVATMGIDILALLIELIYPLILVFHGLSEFKKINRKSKKIRSTI